MKAKANGATWWGDLDHTCALRARSRQLFAGGCWALSTNPAALWASKECKQPPAKGLSYEEGLLGMCPCSFKSQGGDKARLGPVVTVATEDLVIPSF